MKLLFFFGSLIVTIFSYDLRVNNGHVPYYISLPTGMGALWDFPIEWWYYSGYGFTQNNTNISIVLTIARIGSINSTISMGGYGIGYNNNFYVNESIGSGFSSDKNNPNYFGLTIEDPTINKYYVRHDSIDKTNYKFSLINGGIGQLHSIHNVQIHSNDLELNLNMIDTYGCIFEGNSGYIMNNSLEFGFPKLNIINGSIKIHNQYNTIISGNLWLDRQVLSYINPNFILYTGNWIYLNFDNNHLFLLVFFWSPKNTDWKDTQWIIGKQSNAPPTRTIGIDASKQATQMMKNDDFDIDISNPKNPIDSPHWQSPKSGITYGSQWIVRLYDKKYIIETMYQNAELFTNILRPAFEGALVIKSIDTKEVIGNGFIEQMYSQ
jgi:predicted secreted hydrolase